MTIGRKRRGRPPGDGIDDSQVLRKIAEKIAARPGLRATSAYRRITRSENRSDWRRIQRKWVRDGERLLAEISAPRTPARPSAAKRDLPPWTARDIVRGHARMDEMLGIGTYRRAAREMAVIPTARAQHELDKLLRPTRLFLESSTDRLLREFQNDPIERWRRELRMWDSWLK